MPTGKISPHYDAVYKRKAAERVAQLTIEEKILMGAEQLSCIPPNGEANGEVNGEARRA